MHVNINNVFIIVLLTIIISSTMILYRAFASDSIKKGILWMLAFLGLSGIGIWMSVYVVTNTVAPISGINVYALIFATCCIYVAAFHALNYVLHPDRYSLEEYYGMNRAIRVLTGIFIVLILAVFIFN